MTARHLLAVLVWCGGVVGQAFSLPPDNTQDFVYLGGNRPILVRMHVEVNGQLLQTAWNEFVGGLFRDLDANNDGVLSREEAARAVPPQNLGAGGGGFPVVVKAFPANGQDVPFAALDADKDGKVTRDELARYYRTSGFAPFQFRSGNNNMQGGFRVRFVGQPEPLRPEAINQTLFDLLDTDKDGKLSREELTAGVSRLAKLDANDDEMIDVNELNPNALPENNLVAQVAFVVDNSASMAGNDAFVEVVAGKGKNDLAGALLDKYGPKNKTGVRRLTRADLGLDEPTFARLDADGDGALDRQELARFAQRPPDLEIKAHLGKTRKFELLRTKDSPAALADRARPTKDGGLRLDLGATTIELSAAGGGGVQARGGLRPQYLAQFKQADRDNNGYLDRDETRRNPLFGGLFKMIDRDGDGKVFEKEVVAYLDRTERLQESAADCCVSLSAAPVGNGLFDLLDSNRDRRLSVRELRQMGRLIAQLDRNGDSKVGRDEVPRTFRLSLGQGPAGGGGLAGNVVFVANGDVLMNNPPAAEPTAGPLWFRKMDRNRDGDVSRREFLGTDEEFRRLDADGDGLISADEASRADALLRKDRQRKP